MRDVQTNVWTYRESTWVDGRDLVTYDVEASDGHIGKVDECSLDLNGSYLVVDTGWWIFGKKRLVPAGAVTDVHHDDQKVFINLTKDEVKHAPDYDATRMRDADYRREHGEYYGPFNW